MPYTNVPSSMTGKMDRCVKRVVRTGKSKDSAIAICHDAMLGKKKEIDWDALSDEQVEEVIADVLETYDQKGFVPYALHSFAELDQWRSAQEKSGEIISLTGDFSQLVDAVMYDDAVSDKVAAVRALADEFSKRLDGEMQMDMSTSMMVDGEHKEMDDNKESGLVQRVLRGVADLLGIPYAKESRPLLVWKEADGSYRWIARYSNNFRDDDRPAEIISAASHERYVEMVDKGVYPLPQLWLWHRPEWRCGTTTAVAYDDKGFAVATGYFDKGKEYIAEWLSKQRNVAVSHAMPGHSIVRDPQDPSVIVEHQTVEISPLPSWAAANKLTGFVVLEAQKEADMAIPQRKRESFIKEWGIDPSLLDKLEQQNAADAAKAQTEERESKEQAAPEAEGSVKEDAPVAEQVAQEQVTPPADSPQTATDPLEQSPTRREIADAFANVITPITDEVSTLVERMMAIESQLKELSDARAQEKQDLSKAIETIPAASLSALIAQRVVGNSAAAVDGRSSLAKSKPKEAETQSQQRTGIPFLDRMMASDQGE